MSLRSKIVCIGALFLAFVVACGDAQPSRTLRGDVDGDVQPTDVSVEVPADRAGEAGEDKDHPRGDAPGDRSLDAQIDRIGRDIVDAGSDVPGADRGRDDGPSPDAVEEPIDALTDRAEVQGDGWIDGSASEGQPGPAETGPIPQIGALWPEQAIAGGAVFVVGSRLQSVDHAEIDGVAADVPAEARTDAQAVVLIPASLGVRSATLTLVTAAGGRASYPLGISPLPVGLPVAPATVVVPRDPGVAGFDPPPISNFWRNEFDSTDARYFFGQTDTEAGASEIPFAEVNSGPPFRWAILGSYDLLTRRLHSTLRDKDPLPDGAISPEEEYLGVYSDPGYDAQDCHRLVLFPRHIGLQLVLQVGCDAIGL